MDPLTLAYGAVVVYDADDKPIQAFPVFPAYHTTDSYAYHIYHIPGSAEFSEADRTSVTLEHLPEDARIAVTADFATCYPTFFMALDRYIRMAEHHGSLQPNPETHNAAVQALGAALTQRLTDTDIEAGLADFLSNLRGERSDEFPVQLAFSGITELCTQAGVDAGEILSDVLHCSSPLDVNLSASEQQKYIMADPYVNTLMDQQFAQGTIWIPISDHGTANVLSSRGASVTRSAPFDPSQTLWIDRYDPWAETDLPIGCFAELDNYTAYDLTVESPAGTCTAFDDPLTVRLPVADPGFGAHYTVYACLEDGTRTELASTFKDGCVQFETDTLGYFAVEYTECQLTPPMIAVLLFILFIIVLTLLPRVVYRKKNRRAQ